MHHTAFDKFVLIAACFQICNFLVYIGKDCCYCLLLLISVPLKLGRS